MKFEELTKEDQELLKTEFPAELEKQAADQVAQMHELYDVGFTKMAADTATELDKLAEESEKEEKEEESEAHKKLDEEHKKEAAARGAFIARGYVDGLLEKGAELHEDPLHYFYPALSEKLGFDLTEKLAGMKDFGAKALHKFRSGASKAKEAVKSHHGKMKAEFAKATTKGAPKGERAKAGAKALGRAAASGAVGGAFGYGAYKGVKSMSKKES